jgi:metalloendopeptidase OMA1, mitochondrial
MAGLTLAAVALRRNVLVLGALLCSLGLAVGCSLPAPPQRQPSQQKGQGPGGRQQQLALTPEQELELGKRAYQKVLKEYQGRVLAKDSPETTRVRRVSQRIIETTKIRPLLKEINLDVDKYRFAWEENVVREQQVNAFCLPAGKIIVFTGLLQFVGQDDDELATVLAHEIAHALAHHSSERIAREEKGGGSFLRNLAFSREQEAEADHIGVFLMTFAGYNPTAAVRFWTRMTRQGGSSKPELLSDHPSSAHRVAALRAWVPRARAAKQAFDQGRVVGLPQPLLARHVRPTGNEFSTTRGRDLP